VLQSSIRAFEFDVSLNISLAPSLGIREDVIFLIFNLLCKSLHLNVNTRPRRRLEAYRLYAEWRRFEMRPSQICVIVDCEYLWSIIRKVRETADCAASNNSREYGRRNVKNNAH